MRLLWGSPDSCSPKLEGFEDNAAIHGGVSRSICSTYLATASTNRQDRSSRSNEILWRSPLFGLPDRLGSVEPRHRLLGMTDDELNAIVGLLGRDPSDVELAMYSVMWSEHCSYKSSRTYLGRFPTEAPWVLVGPGEGAGVIDVGED